MYGNDVKMDEQKVLLSTGRLAESVLKIDMATSKRTCATFANYSPHQRSPPQTSAARHWIPRLRLRYPPTT